MELRIAFYDSHVSGELGSRLINDSQALSSLTQFTTQTVLGAVVKFLGSLAAMFFTHPKLALMATIITPLNLFLVKRTGRTATWPARGRCLSIYNYHITRIYLFIYPFM